MTVPKLVYTAMSKRDFFCRDAVCEFVLNAREVPLNPFRMFDYFLGDRVERDVVRNANMRVLMGCDEMWVFGDALANGVFQEIHWAGQWQTPMRFFTISSVVAEIREIQIADVGFEAELLADVDGDEAWLRAELGRMTSTRA